MLNFLFYDDDTGEYFYVQCDTESEAWAILEEEYDGDLMDLEFTGTTHSDWEAEQYGYDTY